MISTDNTTVVSYINKQRGICSPMCSNVGNSPLVPGTQYCTQNLSYSRKIQYISRPSLEIGQTSQYRMVFGSIGGQFHFSNTQFSQSGFVCNSIQSQTPIVCISSCGHSKKGKRKVQGVPQSQTAAFPRHQEEEETSKSKQAQIEQMYKKH